MKSWAQEFRLLRTLGGEAEEDIADLLNWYVKNIGKQYIPIAYSAKAFRDKYVRIKDSMERILGPRITISFEAKEIAQDLGRLHWPLNSKEQLPLAIESSFRSYRKFHKALKDQESDAATVKSVRRTLQYILAKMPSTEHFVSIWFTHVNHSVQKWEDWSGDLMPFSLTIDSKRFNKMVAAWVIGYEGNDKNWKIIQKQLEVYSE